MSPPQPHRPGWRWWLMWVVGGVLLGLLATWFQLRPAAHLGATVGPWRVSLLAGSAGADPVTRARVALGGLLALNRSETMYYVATHDSAGRPLRSRCSWRISGLPPPARWWSLTAYADDFFLFPDDQGRYSINGRTAPLDAQGHFSVITGPVAPPDRHTAWLPTPGDRGLVLTLRAYNPDAALAEAPQSLQGPRIEAVGGCS